MVTQMLQTMAQESFGFYSLDALQVGWEFDITQLSQARGPSSARVIQGDRVSLVPMALQYKLQSDTGHRAWLFEFRLVCGELLTSLDR
jgi:hypothetical protein